MSMDIKELERLVSATPGGPWHVNIGTFGKVQDQDPKSATIYATNEDLVYVARCDGSQPMTHETFDALSTAHLIAYLRNHVPDIRSAIRDKERLDFCERIAAQHPEFAKDGLCPMTRAQIDAAMEEEKNEHPMSDVETRYYCGPRWTFKRLRCHNCGAVAVHVYPAHLHHVECECGEWISTRHKYKSTVK